MDLPSRTTLENIWISTGTWEARKIRVHIAGIAGVLGSSLAKYLFEKGHQVQGNDQVRIGEAWKLEGIKGDIDYLWKSSFDLSRKDLSGVDMVMDAAIGFADRPFGIGSPRSTFLDNLKPAMGVLEPVRKMDEGKRPFMVYSSSFNVFYGEPGKVIKEDRKLTPSSVYGWTKASAELLYYSYYRAYEVPTIITRVGSAFGPGGRSDELVHNLIIHALKNEDKYLWSPGAKRLWCYSKDVMEFYGKLVRNPQKYVGDILHCAGNKDNEIVTNIELARRIKEMTDSDMEVVEGDYEPGELVDGEPVSFTTNSEYTQSIMNWNPNYSLEEGLEETIHWFEENLWRYGK